MAPRRRRSDRRCWPRWPPDAPPKPRACRALARAESPGVPAHREAESPLTTPKRPGRSKAGSTMSGRLGAASIQHPGQFSRFRPAPPGTGPRPACRHERASDALPPRLGSQRRINLSSKHQARGPLASPCERPFPDGSFPKLADVLRQQGRPLDRDKLTWVALAAAWASSVLPQPGGPDRRIPLSGF